MSSGNAPYFPPFPSHARNWGVPATPRVVVPPTIKNDGKTLAVTESIEAALRNPELPDHSKVEFLKQVTNGLFSPRPANNSWEYEDRRSAQHVLPFIVLGPSQAARDRVFLIANNITMVIAVRDMSSAVARLMEPKVAEELNLETLRIDVRSKQHLIAAFPKAVDAINEHLASRFNLMKRNTDAASALGKVFLYCETGNERSAAVAAAYIMTMYPVTHVEAIQVISMQRYCVALDDEMRHMLLTYNDILKAHRDLSLNLTNLSLSTNPNSRLVPDRTGLEGAPFQLPELPAINAGENHLQIIDNTPMVVSINNSRGKRRVETIYAPHEEAVTLGGDIDRARFQDREVTAPFADKEEDGWVEIGRPLFKVDEPAPFTRF